MDPLFLNVPRPYNRFPIGYRPLNRGVGAQTKSTFTLHPYGSNGDSIHHDPAILFSHRASSDIEDNCTSSTNNRHSSPDPLIKVGSNLPLPNSPLPTLSHTYDDMPLNNFLKWRNSQSNNLRCELSSYLRRSVILDPRHCKRFFTKLQPHKEKIEGHRHDEQLVDGLLYSYEIVDTATRGNDSNMDWEDGASAPKEIHFHSCPVIPSYLHKTRSDSSIFQESDPRIFLARNVSTTNCSPAMREHRHRYDNGGRQGLFLKWRASKKGFFALKNQEDPSWITDPPPPFAFRGSDDMPMFISDAMGKCNKNSVMSQATSVRLDEAKALNFSGRQTIPEQSPSFVKPKSRISNSAKRCQVSGGAQFSTNEIAQSQLPLNQWGNMEILPPFCSQGESYLCLSSSEQNSIGPSFSHGNKPSSSSTISVTAVDGDTTSRFVHSYRDYKSNLNDLGSDTVLAPTKSKVFTGFKNVGDILDNGNFEHGYTKETQLITNRSKERTFAILSRPQTPLASLKNVNEFINPMLYSHSHSSPNVDEDRLLRGWSGISPTFASFSDNYIPYHRNLRSSMFSYDNHSEADFQLQSFSHPVSSNSLKSIGKTPAHGILVKSHESVPRASKKVVFQCDSDGLDQLLHRDVVYAEAPPHVKAFDSSLSDLIERWSCLSDQIGGDVITLREMVTAVFNSLRFFLWTAASRPEPSSEEVQKLVAPIVNLLSEINRFKDSKRNTPQFNHLCAVAEGIPAVGWVLVKKTPAPYVKEMLESAMFYINRILKEFKEGDQKNIEWARLWKQLLEAMYMFVRQTHTTGLVWNSAPGCSPSEMGSQVSAPLDRPTSGGHALPPPPPPPPSFFADSTPCTVDVNSKVGRDALFAEINKGDAITAGLKKVTAEMQSHKNPALREQPPNLRQNKGLKLKPTPETPPSRPPLIELKDGKQWNVEYVVGNPNVVIHITNKKETVYIYKCQDSVITIKGKLNSITLDSCRKTSVVFDALVTLCETINCQSVQIQTLGEMPTLSIQKTDGCQVYLSETSKNAEIITSMSSEMNVLIPGPEGDYAEFPVPEQFKTTFRDGKLVTCVSDVA